MKAWLLDSQSGLSALRLAETPDPTPGPNEVLLEVHLASLNPADRYLAEGLYPGKLAFPHILGRDAIGTVRAVGAGVSTINVGDVKVILRGEIGVSRLGTFAELVAVPTDILVDVPSGWSHEQAASAALVYLTAYQAITQWKDLPAPAPDKHVLVSGASGGVGIATVQLASAMGYSVIGLSRDEGKWPAIKDAGAAALYSPASATWRKDAAARFGKVPVALAVDNVGGPGFSDIVETLAPNGRISVVGRLAGPVPDFNTSSLFFRRLQIGGVAVGTYSPTEAQAAWKQILLLLSKTHKRPLVDSVFPFDQLLQAFARLKAGPLGKVLLKTPRPTPDQPKG